MINTEKRGGATKNDSTLRFYSLLKEKSFEDMSAIGKNLGLQAVIAAGANFPPAEKNIINLPTILPRDALK